MLRNESQWSDTDIAATVIICTRNRADSLKVTLTSLAGMDVPSGVRWELLIVDNGSADATPKVVEDFGSQLPIRRVFEPNAGLSNARNRGVSEAVGRHIIWTDDDVEVDTRWLTAYLDLFYASGVAAIYGGKSIPRLEPPAVKWFASNVGHLSDLLAVRDFGPHTVAITRVNDRLPFGLNFAVRADVQRQFLFNPALGVAPGRRKSGEEIDVICRMLDAGFNGIWTPAAIVYHRITRERQSRKYVFSYYRSAGEQRAEHDWSTKRPMRLFGVPASVWLKCGALGCAYGLIGWWPGTLWVSVFAKLSFNVGALEQWRRLD